MFNENLLVGSSALSIFFICSREGSHLATINFSDRYLAVDATWTPRGNIIYTTTALNVKMVLMSQSAEIIAIDEPTRFPRFVSVSNDEIIYLTDYNADVYQSTNEGVSWSLVFSSPDYYLIREVIKVTFENSDELWFLEEQKDEISHLRAYSTDRSLSKGDILWRYINVTTIDNKKINFSSSRFSNDGNMNIFLNDKDGKTVQLLPVNGPHCCQLQPLNHHFESEPHRVAVDKKRQLLYVGQMGGVIGVFKLTYGNGHN